MVVYDRELGASVLRRSLITLFAVWFLEGCAAVPPPPQHDGIEVEKIVDAVQCELASVFILNPQYADSVKGWLARALLTLKVTHDAAFAPTITAIPVISSGTLKVPFGPDLQDLSIRTASITFDVHMRDLMPPIRTRPNAMLPKCPYDYSGLPQAYSGLGLADWLSTVATSVGRPDFATLNLASYNLEFTIVRGAHGGFSFVNAQVDVSATGASIKKINYNQLTIAFSSDPAPTITRGGKMLTSPDVGRKLDLEIQRYQPLRLDLQPGSGIIIR